MKYYKAVGFKSDWIWSYDFNRWKSSAAVIAN
jgi:hypothetical protein